MRNYLTSFRGALLRFISSHGLLSLLLLSALVRLIGIGSECYWYDEVFTAMIADLDPASALQSVAGDVHPPLWYLIEWLIAQVAGNGPVAMRLPSALFGIAIVYQVYSLCCALKKERLGLLSATMVSIMPSMLYYSQEARSYALLVWLVLFCTTSLIKRKWLRVALSLSLMMYVHNLAFLYVAVLGTIFIIKARQKAIRYFPLFASYLPWLVIAYRQAINVGQSFWIVSHGPGEIFLELMVTILYVRIPEWLQLHAFIFVIGLSSIAVWTTRKDKSLRIVTLLALLPPVLMYLVSVAWKPIFLERALLPSGVCMVILWAASFERLSKRAKTQLAIVGLPVIVLSLMGFFAIQKVDFESMANSIERRMIEGDVIYHTSIPSMLFMRHYMPDSQHYALPDFGDLDQSLSDDTKTAMGIKQREISFLQLRQLGYKRVWLLKVETPSSNPDRLHDIDLILAMYPVLSIDHLIDGQFATLDVVLIDLQREINKPHYQALPGGKP